MQVLHDIIGLRKSRQLWRKGTRQENLLQRAWTGDSTGLLCADPAPCPSAFRDRMSLSTAVESLCTKGLRAVSEKGQELAKSYNLQEGKLVGKAEWPAPVSSYSSVWGMYYASCHVWGLLCSSEVEYFIV